MIFFNRSVIISSAFALYVLYREVNYEECAKRMPESNAIACYGKKILKLGLGFGCIGLLYVMFEEQRSQTIIMDGMFKHMVNIGEKTYRRIDQIHTIAGHAHPDAPYSARIG